MKIFSIVIQISESDIRGIDEIQNIAFALKGKLSGAWACSVEYDCRIVFSFGENTNTKEEEVILIDIGTHDEVY